MNDHRLVRMWANWTTLAYVMMLLSPSVIQAQVLLSKEDVARTIAVENVKVQSDQVSGDVHNLSSNTLRDVQLLVRYTWLWDNEFKPGTNDPSFSTIYTVQQEIPAGGRAPFTYKPTSAATRSGGHFLTSVSVAGYTEVIQPKR